MSGITPGITRPKRFARQPLFSENPRLEVGPHLKNEALGVAVHAVVGQTIIEAEAQKC